MDQTQEGQPKTITFSLPDEWLVEHWETFNAAQWAYEKSLPAEKRPAPIDIKRFKGALALINAGVVHMVDAPDDIRAKLKEAYQGKTSLPLVGLILIGVSRSIENAFDETFLVTPS